MIWTDGSCLRNPDGPGGWAVVVETEGTLVEVRSGGCLTTTNNIMEMQAVIEALKLGIAAEIVSDSQYVVKGITDWIHNWKRNKWRRKVRGGTAAVLNQGLWEEMDELIDREAVKVSWVKGHDGQQFNEMADRLANYAARMVADNF